MNDDQYNAMRLGVSGAEAGAALFQMFKRPAPKDPNYLSWEDYAKRLEAYVKKLEKGIEERDAAIKDRDKSLLESYNDFWKAWAAKNAYKRMVHLMASGRLVISSDDHMQKLFREYRDREIAHIEKSKNRKITFDKADRSDYEGYGKSSSYTDEK